MNILKILRGEKIPDRDDPAYIEQHRRAFRAGEQFARFLRLNVIASRLQDFGEHHRKTFLCLAFGLVGLLYIRMVVRIVRSASSAEQSAAVVEQVDSTIHHIISKRHGID